MTRIILASGSAIRARILEGAGVPFEMARPNVDESAIKKDMLARECSLRDIAQALADAKATAIGAPADAVVIGSDQLMEFQGRAYDKPISLAEARARFLAIAGAPHSLINAIAVAKAGKIVFRHIDQPILHMRKATPTEIDAYLAAAGEGVLSSVGAYQVEALGSRLFDRIDGDFYAVLGLSLYPLLGYLRREGLLAY